MLMTLPTHLILGLIIGKATGNYPLAVVASIAVDVDHFVPFAQNGVLWSPRKLWRVMTDRTDPLGTPRFILHNVFLGVAICAGSFLIHPPLGLIVSLAYAGHLALDALDDTIYFPLYPKTSVNIRGPIQYFSKAEIAFAAVLIGVWLMI